MAELVRRCGGRHLGGTGASVIAVCERLAIVTVATVNLRDFANVRPRHARRWPQSLRTLWRCAGHGRCAVKACRSTDSDPAFLHAATQLRA